MLGAALRRRDEPYQLAGLDRRVWQGSHVNDLGPALGHSARLVEDDGVDTTGDLERLSVADEDTVPCAEALAVSTIPARTQ